MLDPRALVGTIALCLPISSMAIDVEALWDFNEPEFSEQRFQQALATADADDALILRTQIARTHGLRRDFVRAREVLSDIDPQVQLAGAEARTRHALELGRCWVSATHAPELQTSEARERARSLYMHALELAQKHQLDHLAIDALHMLAFVDTAPGEQLKLGQQALAIVASSSKEAATQWEASLRNNVGYSLHQLGRYQEALSEFKRAAVLRELRSEVKATRVAHWMVAWTLRTLGRLDEALEIQLRLERENDAAGAADPHVYQELESIYTAKQQTEQIAEYAEKRKALLSKKRE